MSPNWITSYDSEGRLTIYKETNENYHILSFKRSKILLMIFCQVSKLLLLLFY